MFGRFRPKDDPGATSEGKDRAFRTVADTYYGIEIPPVPFFVSDGTSRGLFEDYAVIRLARSRHRTFIFAWGTSSLGTLGAARALCDSDIFARMPIRDLLEEHGEAEVLLHVVRKASPDLPWSPGFSPEDIRVVLEPAAPVSPEASVWIKEFLDAKSDLSG